MDRPQGRGADGRRDERRRQEPLELVAPVVEVTLLEDRARVVRRGSLELPAGQQRVRVGGVAPVLSDATLTAALESGAAGARVVDTRTRRRLVVASPFDPGEPSELAELEAERDRLDEEHERLAASRRLMRRQEEAHQRLHDLALLEIAEDVSWGRDESDSWSGRLDAPQERVAELRVRQVEVEADLAELESERRRLAERITAVESPGRREWAAVEVALDVAEAAEYTLRLEYVVPSACWRPYHTARLEEEGTTARIELRTDGCVWQKTGEDWVGVRLFVSTERASLGTEPPKLRSDRLQAQPKPETLVVETRDQEVKTTGLGGEAAASDRLPGIDDGGDTIRLEAKEEATVPSDGRPYRVPLFEFDSEAERDLVVLAELVPAVLERTLQTNRAGRPLLAGPVDLVRNGGFVGRSSLLFVAPDERFALGWGPQLEVRAQRETETTKVKQRIPSSWRTRRHRTRVRLSNLARERRKVTVTERLPVSEIEKVLIEPDVDETTDGRAADRNGFVTWTVDLAPYGHRTLELVYRVKQHKEVRGL